MTSGDIVPAASPWGHHETAPAADGRNGCTTRRRRRPANQRIVAVCYKIATVRSLLVQYVRKMLAWWLHWPIAI
jgi:hypothetical protein